MDEFKMTLELGNDAMQTAGDVAEALRRIADLIENGADSGRIRDDNGNTVGTYELV